MRASSFLPQNLLVINYLLLVGIWQEGLIPQSLPNTKNPSEERALKIRLVRNVTGYICLIRSSCLMEFQFNPEFHPLHWLNGLVVTWPYATTLHIGAQPPRALYPSSTRAPRRRIKCRCANRVQANTSHRYIIYIKIIVGDKRHKFEL